MQKIIIPYPRLTVVCAVMAAYGSLLACNEASWWSTLIVSLIAIGAAKLARIDLKASFRGKLLLSMLICIPTVFYWMVLARLPRPGHDDLSNYRGRTAIFFARINTVDLHPDLSRVRLVLAPYMMLFPVRKELRGQTVLNLRLTGSRSSDVAYSNTMFCVQNTRSAQMQPQSHDSHGSDNVKPEASTIAKVGHGNRLVIPDLKPGMLLQIRGLVMEPARVILPWEFDTRRFLARRGIFSTCTAKSSDVQVLRINRSNADQRYSNQNVNAITFLSSSFSSLVERFRSRIVEIHKANIGNHEGNFLSSVVLGDRAVALGEDLKKDFRDVGLAHLLAASGFNLTVVTGMTYWLARLLFQSVWLVNGFSFMSMFLFVCLAGCSPSIMRAALMCTMLLFSRCVFRSLHAPAALAAALLITLTLDPLSVTDVGLQLSYIATAGIISGASQFNEVFARDRQFKLLKWLTQTVSVIIAAQAAVMPIQLFYFWQIGLLFLPANLLVDPLIMPVTVLGFFSSALALINVPGFLSQWSEFATRLIDWGALYPIKVILGIASFFASFEIAKIRFGPPQLCSLVLYYAAWCLFIISLRKKWHKLPSAIFLALTGTLLFWRPALPNLTVAVFPSSIAVVAANRSAMCLDRSTANTLRLCHDDSSRSSVVEKNLDRFLAYHGICNVSDKHFVLRPFRTKGAFRVQNEKFHCRLVFIDQCCDLRAFLDEITVHVQQLHSEPCLANLSELMVFLCDKGNSRRYLMKASPLLVEIQRQLKIRSIVVINRRSRSFGKHIPSQSERAIEINGTRIICAQHSMVMHLNPNQLQYRQPN